jgi:hypothetical protein
MKWGSILTETRLDSVLHDAKCVDDTEQKSIWAGGVMVCRAWLAGMSKMENETKFLEGGVLEKFTIPLFYKVKWQMFVRGNDAAMTKLGMGKTMDAAILSRCNIAEITM